MIYGAVLLKIKKAVIFAWRHSGKITAFSFG